MKKGLGIFYFVIGLISLAIGAYSGFSQESFIKFFETVLSQDKKLIFQNIYYLQNVAIPSMLFGILSILLGAYLIKSRDRQEDEIEKISSSKFHLVLVSIIILFFEVFLIRYLGQQIRILSYFKNIVLICVFLGIGIGCGLSHRKMNTLFFFPALLFPLIFLAFSPQGKLLGSMRVPNLQEYFVGFETTKNFFILGLFHLILFTIFSNVVFTFVPLGKVLGKMMDQFRPLSAYSLNIAGSILGIILFTLASYLSTPPSVWLLAGFVLWLIFIRKLKNLFGLSVVIGFILITGSVIYDAGSLWSPYYRVDAVAVGMERAHGDSISSPVVYSWDKEKYPPKPELWGYLAVTNQLGMTYGVNHSKEFLEKYSKKYPIVKWFQYDSMEFPFRLKKYDDCLVLGSGMGGEIATAIRNKVNHIEAVEIDPAIAKLSYDLHPEKPFQNKNARLIVDDARSFIHKTKKKFDLVLIGGLDSHTLLSGMSSNRLDSFVYTRESFKQIKKLLKDDGVFHLSFAFVFPWITERIKYTMSEAFPEDSIYTVNNLGIVMTGPGITKSDSKTKSEIEKMGYKLFTPDKGGFKDNKTLSDNWPFLYLKSPAIPLSYLTVLSFLILLSIFLVKKTYNQIPFSPHFFFLGAGFLLLETKSITELSILFGSTWIVNSFVFMVVLFMILFANLIQNKYDLPGTIFYLILFPVLVIQIIITPASFLVYGVFTRILIASILYGVPFLCAAFIFANSFKAIKEPDYMLGANLLGSVLGGTVEYGTLIWGIKSLNVVAIVFYFLSMILRRK
ncbi:MAG: hypothetical protein AB1633_05060 [Elusimicrobiota bacterium]